MAKKQNPVGDSSSFMTNARILYTSEGRSGTVHFRSEETSFDMWYEFAGGNALAIINIPTPQYWQQLTKTPLLQRPAILQFIGEQVVRDQVTSEGYFRIDDDFITIYTGREPGR
ncbi:hypothetical protein [Spirosoma aureum]|nr:hypothetical protein [Spirosoma aureum]